jgi:hypothetical protein
MRVVGSVAVLVLAVGCSAHNTSRESAVVTSSGRIGPLHVDRSDRAAVIAFAGRPDSEGPGQEFDSPRYYALGYSCAKKSALDRFPITAGGPNCRTIFFFQREAGKLASFFTSERRYSEAHGVRVGMASAVAERLLHKRLFEGCETNIYLSSPTGSLTIAFAGGKAGGKLHVTGARVYAFVAHGSRGDVGVWDCM